MNKTILVLVGLCAGVLIGASVVISTDTSGQQLVDLADRLEQAEIEISSLTRDSSAVADENSSLKAELNGLKDVSKLKGENERLKKHIERLQQSIADISYKIDLKQDVIDELTKKLETSRPNTQAATRSPGREKAEGPFEFSNVSFDSDGTIIGQCKNVSGKDFSLATFQMSLFSFSGELVEVIPIVVSNIPNQATRSFETYTEKGKPSLGKHRIEYNSAF